ncbi:hypothetical protein NGM99_20900, partial [Mesorhizobium sp. RP14(2022)]|nr:hypothetical protein [Mesorhizobium liriopis]
AIELSPAYVDVAIQRWQAFTGQEARLEGKADGEALTFAAVAAARGVTLAANASTVRTAQQDNPA